jgi:hypothetical protein
MPTGDSGADQAEIPVPKSTQPVTKPPNRKLQPATRRTQKVWLSVSSVPISEGSRAPSGRLDGVVLGTWGIAALSPRLTSRSPLGTHGFGGGLRRKAKWSGHLLSPISEGSRAPSGRLDGVVLGTWGIAALSPRLTSRSPLGTHGLGECGWRNGARTFQSASSQGRRNGLTICDPVGDARARWRLTEQGETVCSSVVREGQRPGAIPAWASGPGCRIESFQKG